MQRSTSRYPVLPQGNSGWNFQTRAVFFARLRAVTHFNTHPPPSPKKTHPAVPTNQTLSPPCAALFALSWYGCPWPSVPPLSSKVPPVRPLQPPPLAHSTPLSSHCPRVCPPPTLAGRPSVPPLALATGPPPFQNFPSPPFSQNLSHPSFTQTHQHHRNTTSPSSPALCFFLDGLV